MRTILITIIVGTSFMVGAAAQQSGSIEWHHNAQSIIGALDYVAIDYPEAVQNSAVINAVEYAEQREFVTTVHGLLLSLPARPQRKALLEQAQALAAMVEQRAAASEVAAGARRLAAGLIDAYDLIIAPLVAPDPAAEAPLFREQCAACHGISGRGDGPAGAAFDPAPTDFHNVERARQRSLYGLYSTITLGVQGTGMPSFANLSETQRWALAFYVAGLRDDSGTIAQGERFWNQGVLHEVLPTLASLTSSVPADIEKSDEAAAAVLAFLRHRPRALSTPSSDPIERTIRGLQDAVLAYSNDQPDAALQMTLSAYLEGYELIEAALGTLDAELAVGIERDMQVLRNMIRERVSVEAFESTATGLHSRLTEASYLLTDRGSSPVALFTSALVILLREGLEAILLLAAMGLYLRRTEHTNAMQYLHLGWIGALAAGVITWIGIKTVIDISGAQREVVEGAGALLAAIVLLYVGIWLHRRSSASQWQAFLNERLGRSLSAGTLWGIAVLSFVVVYREILETVLFFETLWLQSGNAIPLVLGALAAAFGLIIFGWLIFRIGAQLPLRRFFQVNGALMFVLAFVFAGKGVAALQEAGWIAVTFVALPRIDWLGIYPSAQTVGVQLVVVLVGVILILLGSGRRRLEIRDCK